MGIFAAKIKCDDVVKAHQCFSSQANLEVTGLQTDKKNDQHFWIKDDHQNLFNIVKGNHWFQTQNKIVGGVTGAVIGVSVMDESVKFYQTLLSIDEKCMMKPSSVMMDPMDFNKN